MGDKNKDADNHVKQRPMKKERHCLENLRNIPYGCLLNHSVLGYGVDIGAQDSKKE